MFRTTILALSFVTLTAGAALAEGKQPPFANDTASTPAAEVQDEQTSRGEHNTRVGAYGQSTDGFRQVAAAPQEDRHVGGR